MSLNTLETRVKVHGSPIYFNLLPERESRARPPNENLLRGIPLPTCPRRDL